MSEFCKRCDRFVPGPGHDSEILDHICDVESSFCNPRNANGESLAFLQNS